MKVFKKLIGILRRHYFPIEELLDTIRQNDMDRFNWILAHRIHQRNINTLNKEHISPLGLACHYRHFTFVENLLKAGANPDDKNSQEETLLMTVIKQKKTEHMTQPWNMEAKSFRTLSHVYPDKGMRQTPYSERDTMHLANLLLAYQSDIHALDKHHNNALIHALNCNLKKVPLFLLEHGANPYHQNISGQCAVSLGVEKKFYHFIGKVIEMSGSNDNLCRLDKILAASPACHKKFAEQINSLQRKYSLEVKLPQKNNTPKSLKI